MSSIAAFLGIHLGVEDDAEGNAQLRKARAKEQTQAEKFHAFREVHSQAWHRRRDDLAQEFLDTFVRQNIAEIDDIPTVEHVHEIKLPASEGAVYLELEHHLQALEMQAWVTSVCSASFNLITDGFQTKRDQVQGCHCW